MIGIVFGMIGLFMIDLMSHQFYSECGGLEVDEPREDKEYE